MALTLVIGNKAYSSWSLRPWLAMTHLGIAFEETVIPMHRPETKAAMLANSPAGKVPVLKDGEVTVWETLAILEYLNETYANGALWPAQRAARAHARAIANEMHAGFSALRNHLPMNVRRKVAPLALTPACAADIARIDSMWQDARGRWGGAGPFLFGAFSAADAMYAPVVNRIHHYAVPVSATARAYVDAIRALPAMQRWIADAAAEPWVIEEEEK